MSSKDNKGLKDTLNSLKEIFKRNKGAPGMKFNLLISNFQILVFFIGPLNNRSDVLILKEELLKDLSKDSPITTRVKALKDLSIKVAECKLENVRFKCLFLFCGSL